MKTKTIFVILIFAISNLFSQELEIHLDIIWVKEKNIFNLPIFKEADSFKIPYLKIIYTNNSPQNIYFRKISDPMDSYSYFMPNYWNKPTEDLRSITKKNLDKYNIYIENNVYLGTYHWSIENLEILKEKEEELKKTGIIDENKNTSHDLIRDINSAIYIQNLLNKNFNNKKLKYFNYEDKEEITYNEAIRILKKSGKLPESENHRAERFSVKNISEFYDYFVFLEKGGTFTQYINIVGLMVLGSYYEISFRNDKMNDFVFISPLHNDNVDKIKLPKYLNNYKLYKGKFFSNKLKIEL